jgi:hypothetical protein
MPPPFPHRSLPARTPAPRREWNAAARRPVKHPLAVPARTPAPRREWDAAARRPVNKRPSAIRRGGDAPLARQAPSLACRHQNGVVVQYQGIHRLYMHAIFKHVPRPLKRPLLLLRKRLLPIFNGRLVAV